MTLNRRLAMALGITALFGVAVVRAEEMHQARVSFAFEVAGQKLAAGTYHAVDNAGTLLIRNSATGQGVYILPVAAGLTNSDQSSMTFRCYGSSCFLSQIQFRGAGVYKVRPAKREKELARIEQPQVTLIALR